MTITCPNCSRYFRVPSRDVGLFQKCTHCGFMFRKVANEVQTAKAAPVDTVDPPSIAAEPRPLRRKSKSTWRLWLLSFALAIVVTPLFVAWRLYGFWKLSNERPPSIQYERPEPSELLQPR